MERRNEDDPSINSGQQYSLAHKKLIALLRDNVDKYF